MRRPFKIRRADRKLTPLWNTSAPPSRGAAQLEHLAEHQPVIAGLVALVDPAVDPGGHAVQQRGARRGRRRPARRRRTCRRPDRRSGAPAPPDPRRGRWRRSRRRPRSPASSSRSLPGRPPPAAAQRDRHERADHEPARLLRVAAGDDHNAGRQAPEHGAEVVRVRLGQLATVRTRSRGYPPKVPSTPAAARGRTA